MNVQATGIARVAICQSIVCVFIIAAGFTGIIERAAEAGDSAVVDQRGTDRGFLRKTFADETGLSHRYVVFVPHHLEPGVRPPVLMFLNGVGENRDDGIRQITNNFGVNVCENREYFPFIALAPQCRTEGSWTAGSMDVKWALEILDATIREFNADSDRVYLTGVSAGGSGVWAVASAYPDRFAAIAPMCGTGGADAQSLVRAGVPIWNFSNERDGREVVDFSRTIRKQLIESGSSPLVTEYPVGGHDCWNRAYRTTALYRWLLEHRRPENRKALPFTYLAPEKLLQDWVASEHSTWTADGDVVVGKNNGQGDIVARVSDAGLSLDVVTGNSNGHGEGGRLVSSQSASEFELHGDVWMTANLDCRIGLMTDNPTASEYWISVVLPTVGSGGLTSPGGKFTASREPAALREPLSETRGTLGAEKFIASLESAAQHTLRPEARNDIRVSIRNNHLHVRLNGWPAMEVPLETAETSVRSPDYRCVLDSPGWGGGSRLAHRPSSPAGH